MNIKNALEILTGRWSYSFISWCVLTPVNIFAFTVRGRVFLELSIAGAIYFALFMNLVTSGLMIGISATWLRTRYTQRQPLRRALFSYILIWFITVIVEFILTKYYLHKPLHINSELIASFFPTFTGLILTNLAIGLIAEGISKRNLLLNEIAILNAQAMDVSEDLVVEKTKLIDTIERLLLDQLQVIRTNVQKISADSTKMQLHQTAIQIENYATRVVRDVSQSLTEKSNYTQMIKSLNNSTTLKNNGMIPYFSTFFFLFTEIVAGSFLQAYRNGISGVLLQIELTAVAFVFALLGSKVLSLARVQSLKFQYLLTFFYVIIFYFGLFFFLNLFLSVNVEFVYPFSEEELSLRFTLALVLTSGFISALNWLELINRNLDDIKLINIVEIEFREEEVLATRSRISSALHGPIQGRLAGIAMALKFLEDENSPKSFDFSIIEDEVIPQLNLISKDIEKIFEGRKLREFSNSLEKNLVDLQNEWGRLLEIDWRISDDLKKSHKEGFIINVMHICNEAITNSVRHGQASKIFLDFKQDKDQVRLLIQNNGRQISDDFAYGVGLDSIEKLSENFEFENLKDGGVQLTVTLA